MASEFIFTMRKLNRFYPPDREILKDVTLAFYPGAKIGVIGHNGAGKSSVLRIMAGLLAPDEGEVVAVDGDAGTCDVKLADGTPLQGVAASQVLALHA